MFSLRREKNNGDNFTKPENVVSAFLRSNLRADLET